MQRSVIFFYTQPSPYIAPFNMLNTVKTPRNLIFSAGLNVCILGTMLLPTWAQSAELGDFYNLGPRPKETAVRAGFITLNAARYQGSDEQKISVVPGIFLQASNGLFADPFNGVGYVFEPAGNLIYGIRANIETGRSFANYTVNEQLTLKSALRMGLGDAGDGGLLNLGATYKIYNANFVNVALNASVKYANSSYMQSYFGVSQSQSAASGMAAYQPAAGFAAAQAGLGLTVGFPISREIYVFSSASVQRVMGDAANSPIVKKKTQPAAFVGAVYSF
jgi:MipA family protein